MQHIMSHHHPDMWDGSLKAQQTFFDKSITVRDVEHIAAKAASQMRTSAGRHGGANQKPAKINVNHEGRNYKVTIENDSIVQMYPLQ